MSEPTLNVVIARREAQADGVIVLDLVAPDGQALPKFEPGAHIDVHLPDLVRQYSLCSNPADCSRYKLGVLLASDSRGGSAAIHRALHVGDEVKISLPRNQFPLARGATRSVLIGGGIGITPLLAMAHHLEDGKQSFVLHYCARARSKAAFLSELEHSSFFDRTHLHFDDGVEQQRLSLVRDLPVPDPGTHVYVCGPSRFIDWVIDGATARGYPQAQIHREYFSAEVDHDGAPFTVVLAGSGRTIEVPTGSTIVKALAGAGVAVTVSCEQGICGTCLCQVIEGVPDHRDSYLTGDEKAANDQIMLCCSRSKTPQLVLDL